MKKKTLYQYLGANPNLVSGKFYSRKELAYAFDISYTNCVKKLKFKTTARDKYFNFVKPKKQKLVQFTGELHDKFESRRWYTLKEIADITGIRIETISRRIGKEHHFGHKEIRPRGEVHKQDPLPLSKSQIWLRKKII